ncbi:MAG: hypothetical protein JRI68_07300 [Deltaproteobacteria bacterium]|nr:hypothetical protein [Deltaproteobacteria bacterium]
MLRHLVTTCVVALCAVAFVGRVAAAPSGSGALPVAVVAVKSDFALDQAEALTQALRKAVRDSDGWSLGEATQSLEFLAVKMNCPEPIDAACEARIADVIKADRYLWCVVQFSDKSEQTVSGTLNFFVRGKGTNSVPIEYSANLTDPNDDSLIRIARKAVADATGGTPKGALTLTTGGIAGQLFVDDQPLGALPGEGGTYQLDAGRHRIVVKAAGYADAETSVVVQPATTVEASLTMVVAEDDEPVDLRMIFGISAIVVGAGAGAVGLWQALEVNSIQDDGTWKAVQEHVPTNKDVCEVAGNNEAIGNVNPADYDAITNMCDQADTAEVLQAVMFPLAAVSAGVGAYLLGTSSLVGGDDDSGDEADEDVTAWSVQPLVGPQVQAVTVTYTF